MATAYGYLRCSHADSAKSGLGLDVQQQQVEAYYAYLCTRPGNDAVTWGGIFRDEIVSGWKVPFLRRPGGADVHDKLDSGDHIIFAKLDRAFRNMEDLTTTTNLWLRRGIHVHFVDLNIDVATPNGKLMMHMIGAGAEWYSAMMSERIKDVMARCKKEGRTTTGKMWGMKKIVREGKKYFVPDKTQRAFMQYVVKLKDVDGLTWEALVEEVERILAEKEGRKARPYGFTKYGRNAIMRAYSAEKRLQAEEQARRDTLERLHAEGDHAE